MSRPSTAPMTTGRPRGQSLSVIFSLETLMRRRPGVCSMRSSTGTAIRPMRTGEPWGMAIPSRWKYLSVTGLKMSPSL